MKTPLPESRNRNLPRPEAPAQVSLPARNPLPDAPRRMSSVERRQAPWSPPPADHHPLRRFFKHVFALLLCGGLFSGFIYLYHYGVNTEGKQEMNSREILSVTGAAVWESGSQILRPANPEAAAALDELPLALIAAKTKAGRRFPEVSIIDGDPPPGDGSASHQIVYFVAGQAVLVIRMQLDPQSGLFTFVGQGNRLLPKKPTPSPAAEPTAEPAASPASEPATEPAADTPPTEKVSEQP